MIQGILNLQPQIAVHNEILGKSFTAYIGKALCEFRFPKLNPEPVTGRINKLTHPNGGNLDNLTFWGQQSCPATGFSLIANIVISIENDTEDMVNEVYSSFYNWWRRFYLAVVLVTKQGTYKHSSVSGDSNLTRLQFDNHNREIIESHTGDQRNKLRFSVTLPSNAQIAKYCLSQLQLESILSSIKADTVVRDVYWMLFDAYMYKGNGDNKSAILYGAIALERVLLSRLIKDKPSIKNMQKQMTLGDIFIDLDCIDDTDDPLPDFGWKKTVVDTRNDVMHGRVNEPSEKYTEEFLEAVEKYLGWLFPTDIYIKLLRIPEYRFRGFVHRLLL